jgi:hypothetical protein
MAGLERDLSIAKAKLRARWSKKFKSKWQLDDRIALNSDVTEMSDSLTDVQMKFHIVEGIAKGYDGLARAASREISRRISEQAPRD